MAWKYHSVSFLALAMVTTTACRATIGGAYVGTPPRSGAGAAPGAEQAIRTTITATDPTVIDVVRHGLVNGNASIEVLELDRQDIDAEREACQSHGCMATAYGPACNLARSRGADYHMSVMWTAEYDEDIECVSYKLTLDKNAECKEYEVKRRRTEAQFVLTTIDTGTCEQVPALSRTIRRSFPGHREQSEPEASHFLAQVVPQTMVDLFPRQLALGEPTEPGHLYAVYRGTDYRGLVKAGEDTELTRLSCCFEPGPGDTLVERGRYWVLDGLVGANGVPVATSSGKELLMGAGYYIRAHPIDGGLHVGAAFEAAGRSGLAAGLFTLEGGYTFRPAPALALSPVVGVGFGTVRQDGGSGGDDESVAPHAVAVMRVTWTQRLWLVGVDVGWAISGDYQRQLDLAGPIGRLVAGFRL